MAAGRLALLGGRIALEHLRQLSVQRKADGSMVTDAEGAIQQRLCAEIRSAFPQDGILAEEGRVPPTWPARPRDWWVVDPLDGTANFGLGMPGFAISVGILRNGMPLAGAVYDPIADWLYTASAGHGAWVNGRRLVVRPQPLSPHSLLAIRTPYHGQVPAFVNMWLCRYRLRRFGSTALQLCYAASGGLALVHDQRAMLWDIAGAAPVLQEAGGVLTRPDSSPLFPLEPARYRGEPIALLAGDPQGHAQGLAEIQGGPVRAEGAAEQVCHGA
jgi:myo-inositol-1(or 4)-monophosphatase